MLLSSQQSSAKLHWTSRGLVTWPTKIVVYKLHNPLLLARYVILWGVHCSKAQYDELGIKINLMKDILIGIWQKKRRMLKHLTCLKGILTAYLVTRHFSLLTSHKGWSLQLGLGLTRSYYSHYDVQQSGPPSVIPSLGILYLLAYYFQVTSKWMDDQAGGSDYIDHW